MKHKSIIYNNDLNKFFSQIGFRRNRDVGFYRERNGVLQTIGFPHSSHNEPYVKYYNVSIGVTFPTVMEIGEKLGCYTAGTIGISIGYLTPEKTFKTWRVADNTSNEEMSNIVSDMFRCVVNYAIPYLEKYSTMPNVIQGIELGTLANQTDIIYNLPIFYLLCGEKEKAIRYVNERLEIMKHELEKETKEVSFINEVYDKDILPDNRQFSQYKTFVDKFTSYGNHGDS